MKISELIKRLTKSFETPEVKARLYKRNDYEQENIHSCELLPTIPGNTVNTLLYSLD